MFLVYRFNNKEIFYISWYISGPGLCSRKQSPEALRFATFRGNLSELLTCISADWLNCKAKFLQLFIFLFNSLYILSNLKVKWCLLNAKNGLDFAFGHVSNSFTFYITVEEGWSKRYVCIAYSLRNILGWYLLMNVTFYILHTLHNQS